MIIFQSFIAGVLFNMTIQDISQGQYWKVPINLIFGGVNLFFAIDKFKERTREEGK